MLLSLAFARPDSVWLGQADEWAAERNVAESVLLDSQPTSWVESHLVLLPEPVQKLVGALPGLVELPVEQPLAVQSVQVVARSQRVAVR